MCFNVKPVKAATPNNVERKLTWHGDTINIPTFNYNTNLEVYSPGDRPGRSGRHPLRRDRPARRTRHGKLGQARQQPVQFLARILAHQADLNPIALPQIIAVVTEQKAGLFEALRQLEPVLSLRRR